MNYSLTTAKRAVRCKLCGIAIPKEAIHLKHKEGRWTQCYTKRWCLADAKLVLKQESNNLLALIAQVKGEKPIEEIK